MNRPPPTDPNLIDDALQALRRTTGIAGRITVLEPAPETGYGGEGRTRQRTDGIVRLDVDGQARTYVVETRRIDRFEAIGAVRHLFADITAPHPLLLVTPYLAPDAADRCRALGVEFADAAGNAYLRGPGYLVYVRGQRRRAEDALKATRERAGTPTALRVVFAILCDPRRLNIPYREITKAAGGVALGTIGPILRDLDRRQLTTGGKGKTLRRLVEPRRLLDEWVTTYPTRLRPKLQRRTFLAPEARWWQDTDITEFGGLWGGEVAADRYTNYLKPERITIYLDPEQYRAKLTDLVRRYRLRPDPNGNVEVLEKFWDFPGEPGQEDVVPPILAFADLAASVDGRNLDVADRLYREKIRAALDAA